jgi:hypothetical protein
MLSIEHFNIINEETVLKIKAFYDFTKRITRLQDYKLSHTFDRDIYIDYMKNIYTLYNLFLYLMSFPRTQLKDFIELIIMRFPKLNDYKLNFQEIIGHQKTRILNITDPIIIEKLSNILGYLFDKFESKYFYKYESKSNFIYDTLKDYPELLNCKKLNEDLYIY